MMEESYVPLSPLLPIELMSELGCVNKIQTDPNRVLRPRNLSTVAILSKCPTQPSKEKSTSSLPTYRPISSITLDSSRKSSKDPLVPIRIDIDMEGVRYRDSFCWNIEQESHSSPTSFANRIVSDLKLPVVFQDAIAESIMRQLEAAKIDNVQHFTSTAADNSCFHPITIDIRIRDLILHDQFEWDISTSNSHHRPETFAKVLRNDLGLPQEFEPAIAISIREQVHRYRVAITHPELVTASKSSSKIKVFNSQDNAVSAVPCVLALDKNNYYYRPAEELKEWQPILSQMQPEETAYLEDLYMRFSRPVSSKRQDGEDNGGGINTSANRVYDTSTGPRTINAFIAYCLAHRSELQASDEKYSASEITRMLGEQWRAFDHSQKAKYVELANIENQKRQVEYELDLRRSIVSQWESTEGVNYKQRGFINDMVLDHDPSHVRALFLQEYMIERQQNNNTTT